MNGYYGESDNSYYSNDFYNDMSNPVSNCSRFERRHDFDTFNMADYMACENCRHLNADNKCIVGSNVYSSNTYGRME